MPEGSLQSLKRPLLGSNGPGTLRAIKGTEGGAEKAESRLQGLKTLFIPPSITGIGLGASGALPRDLFIMRKWDYGNPNKNLIQI